MSDKKKKLSLTFRILRGLGFNYSKEAYGQVSPWMVIKRVFKTYRNSFLIKFVMNSWLLSPFLPRKIRPWCLRKVGCHVGKGCFIGDTVKIDTGHADMITLEDGVALLVEHVFSVINVILQITMWVVTICNLITA